MLIFNIMLSLKQYWILPKSAYSHFICTQMETKTNLASFLLYTQNCTSPISVHQVNIILVMIILTFLLLVVLIFGNRMLQEA